MPNDYSFTATFASHALATKERAALEKLFRDHAKGYDPDADFAPSRAMVAYGKRLGRGKTFARLPYKPTATRDFSAAIAHAGAVYVGGPWRDLVRVE